MPRNEEQLDQIREERQEQILEAALKVFARRGLAATKISDIAKAADVSHGLVYHYFNSKEEIFIELTRRAINLSNEGLKELGKLPLEPLEKLKTITEFVYEGFESTEEAAYYFLLMLQASVFDSNPDELKEVLQSENIPVKVLCETIVEGQKKSQIKEGNPMEFAILYWASVQGLALYKISMGENFVLPDPVMINRIFEK